MSSRSSFLRSIASGGDFCPLVPSSRRPTACETYDQANEEQRQEDNKQNLCDARSSRRDSAKSENRRDDGDYQKRQSPTQHCDTFSLRGFCSRHSSASRVTNVGRPGKVPCVAVPAAQLIGEA